MFGRQRQCTWRGRGLCRQQQCTRGEEGLCRQAAIYAGGGKGGMSGSPLPMHNPPLRIDIEKIQTFSYLCGRRKERTAEVLQTEKEEWQERETNRPTKRRSIGTYKEEPSTKRHRKLGPHIHLQAQHVFWMDFEPSFFRGRRICFFFRSVFDAFFSI